MLNRPVYIGLKNTRLLKVDMRQLADRLSLHNGITINPGATYD